MKSPAPEKGTGMEGLVVGPVGLVGLEATALALRIQNPRRQHQPVGYCSPI